MSTTTTLSLTADEREILGEALDADLEDYLDAAREAREEGDAEEATALDEAANRVRALLDKVRATQH